MNPFFHSSLSPNLSFTVLAIENLAMGFVVVIEWCMMDGALDEMSSSSAQSIQYLLIVSLSRVET